MDEYEPTWASLDAHPVPEWYHDAKLGIFIHWGAYSVPAWAPTDAEITASDGSPYAEWYPYYMYAEGSETREYHRERYGEDVEYDDFVDQWDAENWDPERWADLFADVGARYVVLTGEHHDGFPLWDCAYTAHDAAERGPERDIVGDLAATVRERDLRFGASYHANYNYYQSGFGGPEGHPAFPRGPLGEPETTPGREYVDYMNAKHRELIRKYDPDILWFDTPTADSDHLRTKELIAEFYDDAAERDRGVVVNDRAGVDAIGTTIDPDSDPAEIHGDFFTPEYHTLDEVSDRKWEACRGIGHSFGYNRAEDESDHLSTGELVRTFVDVVSKNGNLLLNVGPKADGTIPSLQREPLRGLGAWLDVHGEAIFGSRPWATAEDDRSAVPVRYTWRDESLYATAFEWPDDDLSLTGPIPSGAVPGEATLLSADGPTTCEVISDRDGVTVTLPERPAHNHAFVVRFDGVAHPER
ncbi:alpha-L-fucosidase [Halosimplex amylolyticum]|uniref:alpha-L-fucosidase n=1 Tax=Halosimplex amylolyticum TaxID=3396616 RepID=UPI003F575A62